jgi:site-specific recombinase XerD
VSTPDHTQGKSRGPYCELPFVEQASDFFSYLREERGLRETSLYAYRFHLRRLEKYLRRIGAGSLAALSPAILSAFVADCHGAAEAGKSGKRLGRSSMIGLCCSLRVFLRYLHREGLTARDLSPAVESPRHYRLADVPRYISWEEVRQVLEAVDRRTALGRRDYAMLLLMVTYGLRGHEVAGLTLDDLDWERERLRVPERKAGHSTAYPLSSAVGEAILDYLQHGRPESADRHLFLRVLAPFTPLGGYSVSNQATCHLRRAGIQVARPGSHTFRHSCVQRLVDAEFSFKTIGDYVGHRSPSSTQVYAKVAIETLREVAVGDGEEIA